MIHCLSDQQINLFCCHGNKTKGYWLLLSPFLFLNLSFFAFWSLSPIINCFFFLFIAIIFSFLFNFLCSPLLFFSHVFFLFSFSLPFSFCIFPSLFFLFVFISSLFLSTSLSSSLSYFCIFLSFYFFLLLNTTSSL